MAVAIRVVVDCLAKTAAAEKNVALLDDDSNA